MKKFSVDHSIERTFLWGGVCVCAVVILILRLYFLQFKYNEKYKTEFKNQTTSLSYIFPARGNIVDRNGIALARNRSMFNIDLDLVLLLSSYKKNSKNEIPIHIRKRRRRGKTIRRKEVDIFSIVQYYTNPILFELNLLSDLNPKKLRTHYRNRRNTPYHLKTSLSFENAAKFLESDLGKPGVYVELSPMRFYPYGALASHVLGYIGPPREQKTIRSGKKRYITEIENEGRRGMEEYADKYLQGKSGRKIRIADSRGNIQKEHSELSPILGNDVHLTLDIYIQYILENAMKDVGRGAAVVLDPSNGDILAIVSIPNYDPNEFIPSISSKNWAKLNTDQTAPLYNRAIASYAPGSIFKPLIALVALENGVITPTSLVPSPSVIRVRGLPFRNFGSKNHGQANLTKAISKSINTYFISIGIELGISKIYDFAKKAGFGQKTGFPISNESRGILPNAEWLSKNIKNHVWTPPATANISIGQGYLKATPLQMALFMGAVANGGTLFAPRLIKKITTSSGEIEKENPPQIRSQLPVSPESINAVKEAMLAVVEGGTGSKAALKNVRIAGKTGTADFKTFHEGKLVKDNRTWFYGFAPYENPRYVFCILVEGGKTGGGTSAPIAKKLLKGIFEMESGVPVFPSYVEPAKGNFDGIQKITSDD